MTFDELRQLQVGDRIARERNNGVFRTVREIVDRGLVVTYLAGNSHRELVEWEYLVSGIETHYNNSMPRYNHWKKL